MTKWTEINGKTIVLGNGSVPANMVSVLLYNRAYEVSDKSGLDKADFVDVAKVAQDLWSVKAEIDSRFAGIEDQTAMAILALAMNEHAFFISPPGTGKTSIVTALGQAISGSYWSIQINNEKTTDDLIGPIDSQAYTQKGQFKRKLHGMATSDVVLLDEIWKGAQVSNITLEPLEERKLTIGDEIITMPLMTAIAASNEMPPAAYNAALDRFLLRQNVNYINPATNKDNFKDMFKASGLRKPIQAVCEADDIRLLAAAIDALSMDTPDTIIDGCLEIGRILQGAGLEFGPRRWIRTAKAAIAWALLHGETPDLSHLSVGRWTLWNDPEESAQVEELILGATDPFAGAILTFKGILESAQTELSNMPDDATIEAKAEIVQKLFRLNSEIDTLKAEPGAAKYVDQLAEMQAEINQTNMTAMSG